MKKPQNEKQLLKQPFTAIKSGLKYIKEHPTINKSNKFLYKYDNTLSKNQYHYKQIHTLSDDDKLAMQYQDKVSNYLMIQNMQGVADEGAKRLISPTNIKRVNYQIGHPKQSELIRNVLKTAPKGKRTNHHKVNHNKKVSVSRRKKLGIKHTNQHKKMLKSLKQNNNIER